MLTGQEGGSLLESLESSFTVTERDRKKARESKITAGAGTEAELRYPERNWNLRVLSTARLHASEQGVEGVAVRRSVAASYHITPPPSP